MGASPGNESRTGSHSRGRVSPAGPMQPGPPARWKCRGGLRNQPRRKRSVGRGGSKPARRPRGHPRTWGPLSGDATSTRSSRGPVGSQGGDKTPRNPLRPSPSVPSLPPARRAPRRADAATFPRGHGTVAAMPEPRAGAGDSRQEALGFGSAGAGVAGREQ